MHSVAFLSQQLEQSKTELDLTRETKGGPMADELSVS